MSICIGCGIQIPEGMQVCKACMDDGKKYEKLFKSRIQYLCDNCTKEQLAGLYISASEQREELLGKVKEFYKMWSRKS